MIEFFIVITFMIIMFSIINERAVKITCGLCVLLVMSLAIGHVSFRFWNVIPNGDLAQFFLVVNNDGLRFITSDSIIKTDFIIFSLLMIGIISFALTFIAAVIIVLSFDSKNFFIVTIGIISLILLLLFLFRIFVLPFATIAATIDNYGNYVPALFLFILLAILPITLGVVTALAILFNSLEDVEDGCVEIVVVSVCVKGNETTWCWNLSKV